MTAGSLKIKDTSTVTVHFDKFWIDGTELREQLPEDEGAQTPCSWEESQPGIGFLVLALGSLLNALLH